MRRLLLLASFLLAGCSSTPLYAPCDEGSECEGPADGCYRLLFERSDGSEGDGTLCSRGCASDADCRDGACLALEGDPDGTFLCFEACGEGTPAAERGCYDGHTCTPVTGASVDAVCLPG